MMPFPCKAFLLLAAAVVIAAPVGGAERGISVSHPGVPQNDGWGTYHALIIGIDAYQQWPRLRTAVKDAQDIAGVLVAKYGFKKENLTLRLDSDATRLQVMADLRRIAAGMSETDNLLIYYAGHGQLDDLTGDGYWVPVDGSPKEPGTWLANSYIKGLLGSERVKAKNVLIIADSCYSGAMLRGGPSLLPLTDAGYVEKLRAAAARRSRQIISSGGLEPVSDGGADSHSLFAYYLIKAMSENDREVIDLENLFNTRVWKPVTEIGGQRPSVGRLKTPMDDDGQFVLFNQAWVEEQRRAEEKQREEAEAVKMKAREADQMAALQAERQRIEIERQKLEMEKDLLAQKQQLGMEKLELESQKQELAFQKMAMQLEAMKKLSADAKAAPAPPAAPPETVAAVSQKTLQPPQRPTSEAVVTAALLNIYSHRLSNHAMHYANIWGPLSAAGLKNALGREHRIKLTSVDKNYAAFSKDFVSITDDIIDTEAKNRLWKRASFFAVLPDPVVGEAAALGRKLGVDIVFLIRMTVDMDNGHGDAYLIDVSTQKVFTHGGRIGAGSVSSNFSDYFSLVITDYLSPR
ncbi:MAG: caspase family protein [Pseudomonadota bacterium]